SAPAPDPEPVEEEKPQFTPEIPKTAPEVRKGKKPMFSFDIPKSELPAKPLPPELPAEKAESAADFHVAEPPHASKKRSHTTTSTLQRLPRITPGGSKPSAPPVSPSTLLRRTTSLPGVRPLTEPLMPLERTEAPIRAAVVPASIAAPSSFENAVVLPDETASYKEQIAHLNQERDNLAAKVAELSFAAQERDEANFEASTLRTQLAAAQAQKTAEPQSDDVARVTQERDAARRDYAELRQQYEKMKQDQLRLKNEHAAALADLQKQTGAVRRQGGGQEQEPASGKDDVIETLKQELKSLHEEAARAKDEASTSQRGLALSQKALKETREALREASDAKGALENLRKERATLVQQNMLLQAQNDQIERELSALKASK
ncbi:MAG: hypothetical protein LV481_15920, partial [Methylacidiphilales bacterium]|nr:hypothetical protein [Candidatus Methylacidiphilales bacterium]